MSTTRAKGSRMINVRPAYRALGTYTYPELQGKLENTMDVSRMNFSSFVVPHVEAYGRYLSHELADADGNFGFIILPVPRTDKERAAAEGVKKFIEVGDGKDVERAVLGYYAIMSGYIAPLIEGLRELHDKRHAHLQPHMSNFYLIDGLPYLTDWATMVRMGGNREENILNRVIDIARPVTDYCLLFTAAFSLPDSLKDQIRMLMFELVMEIYSGEPEKEIHALSLVKRAKDVLGRDVTDDEVVAQWMKDIGLEGFPVYGRQEDSTSPFMRRGVGRNSPCPCGSGKKFKRCCGSD